MSNLVKCLHPPCQKMVNPEWSGPYCDRHDKSYMSADDRKREGEVTYENKVVNRELGTNGWDGTHILLNSITSAVKWSADADDFPIGSKLIIRTSVEVVLPEEETAS